MALHIVQPGETPPDIEQEKPAVQNIDDYEPEADDADDANMPGVRFIEGIFAWFETMLSRISGYVLLAALAIGGIDTFTDGKLTQQGDWTIYMYGIAMAAGVGGQLVGMSYQSSRSFKQRTFGGLVAGVSFLAIVGVLAYLEYITANAFSYHKAFGVPTVQTLQDLGWTPRNFVSFRNAVALGLIVLSGFTRQGNKKRKSLAQLRKENEYNQKVAEENAKNQQAALTRTAGLFGNAGKAARAAIRTATEKVVEAPQAAATVAPTPATPDASPPNE